MLCTVRTPWMPSASAPLAMELVSCAAMKAALGARQPERRTTNSTGITDRVSRPSRRSSHSSTVTMPNSSTMSPTERTDVSRNSCIELTSPCRRDISRPTSVLSMKRQRDALQVREHGAAQVEQHVLGDLADDDFLHVAGAVVDEDRRPRRRPPPRSAPTGPSCPRIMPLSMAKRMISGIASWVSVNTSTAATEMQHLPAIGAARSSRCGG